MSFKERDDSFQKFRNFDPHSRLSDFRKRFQDLAQETNNRSNMLFDRHTNGWPLNPRHVYSMAKSANLRNRSNDGEEEGIPIKVIHETSNETPIPNEDRNEHNEDTISSSGSSHSNKSTAQQSSSSSNSNSSGSVFHSNGPQSQSNEASVEPRVHHIPIKIEPRDGSTSSGYTSEPTINATEQPLSRSSSSSSRQSGQSSASHSSATARSPSPAKSVSSSHSNPSSNPSNSPKTRIHQIPVVVEGKDSQKSRSPLNDNNVPKVKTTGLGQSRTKGIKTKSGPFVTRIPVVGEPDTSELQTESPPKEQTIKLDPLELINKILTDLQKYEIEVNQFDGTQDKRYRYLDEMLTRCIIKLDTIETEGKEDVRKARKEAVLAVNKCIALLESKLKTLNNANDSNEMCSQQQTVVSTPEQMVVSTPEPVSETVISEKAKENEEQVEQMQIDQTVDNPQEIVSNDNKLPVNNEQKIVGQRKETAV